jgi:hypothetical protein
VSRASTKKASHGTCSNIPDVMSLSPNRPSPASLALKVEDASGLTLGALCSQPQVSATGTAITPGLPPRPREVASTSRMNS